MPRKATYSRIQDLEWPLASDLVQQPGGPTSPHTSWSVLTCQSKHQQSWPMRHDLDTGISKLTTSDTLGRSDASGSLGLTTTHSGARSNLVAGDIRSRTRFW